jgi:hypothetical protein
MGKLADFLVGQVARWEKNAENLDLDHKLAPPG